MIRKETVSVLEVNFEGWVQYQEPEVGGRTFQQRQHHEQRQSYNMTDIRIPMTGKRVRTI